MDLAKQIIVIQKYFVGDRVQKETRWRGRAQSDVTHAKYSQSAHSIKTFCKNAKITLQVDNKLLFQYCTQRLLFSDLFKISSKKKIKNLFCLQTQHVPCHCAHRPSKISLESTLDLSQPQDVPSLAVTLKHCPLMFFKLDRLALSSAFQ